MKNVTPKNPIHDPAYLNSCYPMNDSTRQAELHRAFQIADAISRLEGYDPDPFEKKQKRRIIRGEISIEEFIQIMHTHLREVAAVDAGNLT